MHLAKVAFEKYFRRTMKEGGTEPLFENLFMNAIGVMKRKDKK